MSSALDLTTADLCFIDTETTGPRFGHHEVIEVAAIRTTSDASIEIGVWHRRIAPLHPERMTEYARTLTGYDPSRVAEPANATVWGEFAAFANRCVPVCHNPSFDRAFITLAASATGVLELGVDYHWLGTETLVWPLFKRRAFGKLSLADACQYLGVEPEPPVHNALDGARACRRVYMALMQRYALQAADE